MKKNVFASARGSATLATRLPKGWFQKVSVFLICAAVPPSSTEGFKVRNLSQQSAKEGAVQRDYTCEERKEQAEEEGIS